MHPSECYSIKNCMHYFLNSFGYVGLRKFQLRAAFTDVAFMFE